MDRISCQFFFSSSESGTAGLAERLGSVAALRAVSLSVCQSVSCPVARTA